MKGRSPALASVCGLLALVIFALSAHAVSDATRVEMEHLGGEYYNIARALADGRGFSDPFGEATGPTAWMPPFYCWLLAAALVMLKTKAAVAACMLVVQNLAYVGIGAALYVIARRTLERSAPMLGLALYVIWLAAFRYWFFVLTTDIWLIAGLAALMLLTLVRWAQAGEIQPWRWGLLAGLAALVSPALMATWAVLTTLVFWRSARPWKSWLVGAAMAGCIGAPWTLRNAWTFGHFIPTKSNLGYELYLANVIDQDGVYESATMSAHPFAHVGERFEYARLGETGFVSNRQGQAVSAMQAAPIEFLRRVGHRITAATVRYAPFRREKLGPLVRRVRDTIYALPALLLPAALLAPAPRRRLPKALALAYALSLAPYVLVAFYSRYLLGLTPILVCLCMIGLDNIGDRVARVRTAAVALYTRASRPSCPAAPSGYSRDVSVKRARR